MSKVRLVDYDKEKPTVFVDFNNTLAAGLLTQLIEEIDEKLRRRHRRKR